VITTAVGLTLLVSIAGIGFWFLVVRTRTSTDVRTCILVVAVALVAMARFVRMLVRSMIVPVSHISSMPRFAPLVIAIASLSTSFVVSRIVVAGVEIQRTALL